MPNYESKIAIIGCGYSGLAAIRRCIEFRIHCTAFEINCEIGGLWVYTDKIGEDEYGIPIQTSLYDGLILNHLSLLAIINTEKLIQISHMVSRRTNSPKQLLEFPDFPFITEEDTCFPRHVEVRRYLNEFTKHFNLIPKIKFQHYVTCVSKVNDKWKLLVRNLKSGIYEDYYFDGVMVCNGHNNKPHVPSIPGTQFFKGTILHCRDYSRSDIFKNKKVLIVGKGPSGAELAYESSLVAEKTCISCRSEDDNILRGVITRPQIKAFKEFEVEFTDGSHELVDVVVFCTGYEYYYPFLDQSCGISVSEDGQIVESLYKHFINIEQPTMCFIGLFQRNITSFSFDLQVQAFLKTFACLISLPPKSEMLEWLRRENERKNELGMPRNRYYHLSDRIVEYFEDITTFAKLKNIPPVLFEIFRHNQLAYMKNFLEFRRWNYKILDDYTYEASLQ